MESWDSGRYIIVSGSNKYKVVFLMCMRTVKICPRCGSTNIGTDSWGNADAWDFCKDCNYRSHTDAGMSKFPPILEIDAEFREDIKKTPVVKR
jgi:predicted nucleic-acid-binding Zn-ribbon protein